MTGNDSRKFFSIISFLGGLWMIYEGYQHYRYGVDFFGIYSGGRSFFALGTIICLWSVYVFFLKK